MTRTLTLLSIKMVVLFCLIVLPAAAFADESADAGIARAVRKSIVMQPYYGVFDWVEGEVKDGSLTLSGWVREPMRKVDIERRVKSIEGVSHVENRIEVLPLSGFDDQLRVASLRLIYGQSALSGYALGANPSIHVIVDGGRVTLKGVVANNLDRQIAETVLRTNLLAFEVKNELEVESGK